MVNKKPNIAMNAMVRVKKETVRPWMYHVYVSICAFKWT